MTKRENRGPELELHSPGLHGSGNSCGTYYKVEYRSSYPEPKFIGNAQGPLPFVIDHYWRALSITLGAQQWGVNIPLRRRDEDACKHGLLSYVAAEAHRWAFIAALEAGAGGPGGALCVETRIVAVKLTVNYSTEELGVYAPSDAHCHKPEGTIAQRNPKLPIQEAAAKVA